MRDNEVHYEMAGSADKDYVVTEGAAHTGPPCVPCETFPGQYANSATNQANYMASWVEDPGAEGVETEWADRNGLQG